MAGGGPGNTALMEVGQETDKEGGRGEVSLLAKAEGMDRSADFLVCPRHFN